jgi:hypothetical protein
MIESYKKNWREEVTENSLEEFIKNTTIANEAIEVSRRLELFLIENKCSEWIKTWLESLLEDEQLIHKIHIVSESAARSHLFVITPHQQFSVNSLETHSHPEAFIAYCKSHLNPLFILLQDAHPSKTNWKQRWTLRRSEIWDRLLDAFIDAKTLESLFSDNSSLKWDKRLRQITSF